MTTDKHDVATSAAEIRIWEVSDCEWYAGAGDAAEILAAYIDDTGLGEEEASADGEYPRLLTEAELDSMNYMCASFVFPPSADGDSQPTGEPTTFRIALARAIATGEVSDKPSLFAATEF